jgi:hypothetical protein
MTKLNILHFSFCYAFLVLVSNFKIIHAFIFSEMILILNYVNYKMSFLKVLKQAVKFIRKKTSFLGRKLRLMAPRRKRLSVLLKCLLSVFLMSSRPSESKPLLVACVD